MIKPSSLSPHSDPERLAPPPFIGAGGKQQEVTEGFTQSGQWGLFTGGFLVLPLREGDSPEAVATRHGFKFTGRG